MASHRKGSTSLETVGQDISSLSSALAKVQRLADTNAFTMARKIGFAVGLELAKRNPGKHCDINSELASLSRRLNLGKVVLREWNPVLFVTHTDSKAENLEAAFGEGVLEGIVQARSGRRVFVKHSIPPGEQHGSTFSRQKSKGMPKI